MDAKGTACSAFNQVSLDPLADSSVAYSLSVHTLKGDMQAIHPHLKQYQLDQRTDSIKYHIRQ